MKKMLTILLCFFLAACNRSVFVEKDSGRTINLMQGDEFQINLAENPTTGYTWEFLTEPKMSKVVREINSQYITKKSSMMGAGGRKIITFMATEKGKVELRGFYKRAYENILILDAMDEARVRYTIIVN